jgi:hypothetical protein
MRIQLVMRGGIELESPWRCNRAFGPQDGSLLLRRPQVRKELEPLFWIRNTRKRFRDGYNYFGRHPEKVIGFSDKHMK